MDLLPSTNYFSGEFRKISTSNNPNFKSSLTSGPIKINIDNDIITHQTISDCVEELIETSYYIYNLILSKKRKTTIVCGGQSPSYYCLAMMNFSIYNKDIVDIVILPHSKGGQKSDNILEENKLYSKRLKEKNIKLRKNVVIIDGVHSGVGILSLESALNYYDNSISIRKYAINALKGIAKIYIDEEIISYSEPRFSDTFPRLVVPFYSRNFHDKTKFITEFINIDSNPLAHMIINIAKNHPTIPIVENEWFKLNNDITREIRKEKKEHQERMRK